MINIQINEKTLFKFTGLLPRYFEIPAEFKKNLEQLKIEVTDIQIFDGKNLDFKVSVNLKKLKIYLKIFKLKIPILRLRRTSGEIIIKFFLNYNKDKKILTATPLILKSKLKKIPKPFLFIANTLFNIFYRKKSQVHINMEDIPLAGISLNRKIVVSDVITRKNSINLIGHLDNQPSDRKIPWITDKKSIELHSHKDLVALVNTDFIDEIFFEILPKYFSTGVKGLPDVEFNNTDLSLFPNNTARLELDGKLHDIKENPFKASLRAVLNYVRKKQHILLTDIKIEHISIENSAYNSVKKIIELFVKAYLTLPITLPHPNPVNIPIPELDTDIPIRFSNPSYNINKDLFIISMDTHS
jgi:hypothetical protein